MVWQLNKGKKTIAFSAGDFAELQSVAISQWSLRFLHLAVCSPKTMQATAAMKKRPHELRELKVHTTG